MIDKFFIESAKNIRSEYLFNNKQLDVYKIELHKISDLLMSTAKELEHYRDVDIHKEKDFQSIKNYIVDKLENLENESNKLAKKIKPINDAIERIKQDELILYKKIKEKYPNLSDQEIRDEIGKHIVE
jgi:predicted  nucleic acid-binding Zn-ribbon protein